MDAEHDPALMAEIIAGRVGEVGKGITALAQPTERIGVAAFESLLGRLRGDSGAARRIDFKANLIIRGSTQPQ